MNVIGFGSLLWFFFLFKSCDYWHGLVTLPIAVSETVKMAPNAACLLNAEFFLLVILCISPRPHPSQAPTVTLQRQLSIKQLEQIMLVLSNYSNSYCPKMVLCSWVGPCEFHVLKNSPQCCRWLLFDWYSMVNGTTNLLFNVRCVWFSHLAALSVSAWIHRLGCFLHATPIERYGLFIDVMATR